MNFHWEAQRARGEAASFLSIWWILPKPSKKVSTRIQSIQVSLFLEISPTKFISRETLDLEEFENESISEGEPKNRFTA